MRTSSPASGNGTRPRRCSHGLCLRRATHRYALGHGEPHVAYFCDKHAELIDHVFHVAEHENLPTAKRPQIVPRHHVSQR